MSGGHGQGRAVGLELTVEGLDFEIYGLEVPAETHYVHNLADFGVEFVGIKRGTWVAGVWAGCRRRLAQ